MRKLNTRQLIRFIVILALGSLSIGAIAYSARSVRYKVDGIPTTEFTITDLSLTHSIERGADGKLTNPYANSESKRPESVAAKNAAGPSPVLMAANTSSTKKEVAAKKTAPGKQVSKKPAKKTDSKKPAQKPTKKTDTKKPSKKPRPGAGKACPT